MEEVVEIEQPKNYRDDDAIIKVARIMDGEVVYKKTNSVVEFDITYKPKYGLTTTVVDASKLAGSDMLAKFYGLDKKAIAKGQKLEYQIAEKKVLRNPNFIDKLRLKGFEESLMLHSGEGSDYARYKKLRAIQAKTEAFYSNKAEYATKLNKESNLAKLNDQLESLESKWLSNKHNKNIAEHTIKNRIDNKRAVMINKFHQDNLEELSNQKQGAVLHLWSELMYIENINDVFNKYQSFCTNIKVASALHEDWRQTRKLPDGTFDPRWKAVKDASFAEQYATAKELPNNLRINDGKLEIDIANTKFSDLSYDWQQENMEAACVVTEMAKSGKFSEPGPIGHKIHEEWLSRNEWAKSGELGVPFAALSKEEQLKDLRQYEIAKKVLESEQSKTKGSEMEV